MATTERHTASEVVVTGDVQGVGFRYSARSIAASLQLVGWVRNTPSGTVEARVQGPADAVAELVAWLGSGPRGARVQGTTVTAVAVDPSLTSFEILA